jgi:PBS lyase HEAT-like repeat-containing protein
MYGFDHKRTEAQFETAWNELQQALPKVGDGGFLLGVSDNKLLLDGIPLEAGQAERSFAHLLNAAGLASIHFSSQVKVEDFARLVRAFALGGSKAQEVAQQIKQTLGDGKNSTIKINEVKFIAADPATGEISVAASIAAQTLGPEFKDWLNDPQKLLQLIAAAEGSQAKGITGSGGTGTGTASNDSSTNLPAGTFASYSGALGLTAIPGPDVAAQQSTGHSGTGTKTGTTNGVIVPLHEAEVVQAIRLLTRMGEVGTGGEFNPEQLKQELTATSPRVRLSLQDLLESLASTVKTEKADGTMLMKAAEHMAIRFALERYQKGEVRVNAVHQMLEHMSRQMDTLRQILRLQEDKMSKAGLLVESHADILDRMFWAEVPESGKRSVLLSNEAACVPARNIRQFVELLLGRGDKETAEKILRNYLGCLGLKDPEARRKTSVGLSTLADLYAVTGNMLAEAVRQSGEQLVREQDGELQSLMGAAFVRLSQEASTRRHYGALVEVLTSLDAVSEDRPMQAKDLRPRIGVENRLPEFIEEALRSLPIPTDLLGVLRKTPEVAVEHVAERFFRCMQRQECDRMVDLVKELGSSALQRMRDILGTGQPSKAASVVGLMSRLDVPSLLELLPGRLPEWNRFYHDIVVRQVAFGAAYDRGRTLLELLEILDPVVLPEAVDEIGMSGDRTAVPPLMVIAEAGEAQGRSAYLQLKAVESLGRLREADAVPLLRRLLETRKHWKYVHHRELRVAAAQALIKIDPRYSSQIMAESGLEKAELEVAALDAAPACPWVRQRRYERFMLSKTLPASIGSSWGKSQMLIRELSLGGGLATKEDNLRVGSEGTMELSLGMRTVRAHVLLRRAKLNEMGIEIVNTDLDSRYRLRRLLVENLQKSPDSRSRDWDGSRKA